MSEMYEYKGTIQYQNSFGKEVSNFMNKCDFSGEWAVTEYKISFKSASNKSLIEFEEFIKECFEQVGAVVFEVKLYKRQINFTEEIES